MENAVHPRLERAAPVQQLTEKRRPKESVAQSHRSTGSEWFGSPASSFSIMKTGNERSPDGGIVPHLGEGPHERGPQRRAKPCGGCSPRYEGSCEPSGRPLAQTDAANLAAHCGFGRSARRIRPTCPRKGRRVTTATSRCKSTRNREEPSRTTGLKGKCQRDASRKAAQVCTTPGAPNTKKSVDFGALARKTPGKAGAQERKACLLGPVESFFGLVVVQEHIALNVVVGVLTGVRAPHVVEQTPGSGSERGFATSARRHPVSFAVGAHSSSPFSANEYISSPATMMWSSTATFTGARARRRWSVSRRSAWLGSATHDG